MSQIKGEKEEEVANEDRYDPESNADAYTASIYTGGRAQSIYTDGHAPSIYTDGHAPSIYTDGHAPSIYTDGRTYAPSDVNMSVSSSTQISNSIPSQLISSFPSEAYVSATLSPFETFNSSHRLELLRSFMVARKLSAYIIPSEDEHQSEYTAAKDQRRSFISGFTGSSGVAIVTLESAALSTDGRYFLQAARQLDGNWQLLKQNVTGYPSWQEWVVDEVLEGLKERRMDGIGGGAGVLSIENASIGVDPRLISVSTGLDLKERCFNANIGFATIMDVNLVDKVMQVEGEVPPENDSKIFQHELEYSGETTESKLQRIRSFMTSRGSFAVVVSSLDEIAWLLNLRGNDIAFNPVFFSYVIVTLDSVSVYVDRKKITPEIRQYLLHCTENLHIFRYNQFWQDLPALDSPDLETEVVCTESEPSYALYTLIPSVYEIERRSIVTELKGIKNSVEIVGNRRAQLRDSVALCQFFAWLEEQLQNGVELSEMDAANRATYYRSLQPHFKGLSFATISASGANSSVVHYEPTEEESSPVDRNKVFLFDSGAQYPDGTTDITRTFHFGRPSLIEKKLFSLVLSGHLNVAMLNFKPGTSSYYIDSLARRPLLKHGFDYSHGTGHGIDTYICVHSGPCGLSPAKTSYNYKPLEAGNFISDEPGCYLDNQFGIRIESDVLVAADEPHDERRKSVLHFEYLTLVPFGLNLIDKAFLSDPQVKWINSYHKAVRENVAPYLMADQRALAWLLRETREI